MISAGMIENLRWRKVDALRIGNLFLFPSERSDFSSAFHGNGFSMWCAENGIEQSQLLVA